MENIKTFILGFLAALVLMLLTGATQVPNTAGKYQISAWGASAGDSYRFGYYVVDTTTGKVVSSRE